MTTPWIQVWVRPSFSLDWTVEPFCIWQGHMAFLPRVGEGIRIDENPVADRVIDVIHDPDHTLIFVFVKQGNTYRAKIEPINPNITYDQ